MKYRPLLYFLLVFLVVSCNDASEKDSSAAYFGGHIVNPTSEFIVVSKDSSLTDTVFLTGNNNFSYRLENAEKGLYNFQHSFENQVIYLAPGDSLLVWVNTLEFDESMNFSGEGAKRNNFILNLFLQNEGNTELVLDYYKIKPDRFQKLTDSIKTHRLKKLNQLEQETEVANDFVQVAEKMVQIEFNNLRERYTYLVNKYHPDYSNQFPPDFYDYREKINFNEGTFKTNPAYLRFLDNYLINYSMRDCSGDPKLDPCFDQNNYNNIIKRIELVDSLIDLPMVRSYMFNHLGATGLVMGENREELRAVLNALQEKSLPKEDFLDLVTLGNIQLAFIPGTNVGFTPVISAEENNIRARNFIDAPTVVYLWSIYSPNHHKEQHKKINDLKAKYPEVDFIGMNIDIGETSAWRNALQKYGYSMEKELQLDTLRIMGRLIRAEDFKPYLQKLLFLDSSGTVVYGDSYLNSPDFESDLLEFLNR